jgi:DNA polymerase III delta subunit
VSLETVLEAVESGQRQPLYLVVGDRVLAEPAAVRLGEQLAAQAGCEAEVHRRPESLGAILTDLRTFSLFSTAKVTVVVDSAVLADLAAAAVLLAEAVRELPVTAGDELPPAQRRAAVRLLQVLRLYQVDPQSGATSEVVDQLPAAAFAGKTGRKPGAGKLQEIKSGLAELLEAARADGIEGRADSDLALLAEAHGGGLPAGHALVLAESGVARDHPLVAALAENGALVELERVEPGRRGDWQGLDGLVAELESQTGVGIDRRARDELAHRTLQSARRKRGTAAAAAADSTTRFAAEYRKLASLTGGGVIDRELVLSVVEDRGEEDQWQILDKIGAGAGGEAVHRLRRLMASAEDPMAARLSFFGLVAEFARHLTAVGGSLERGGIAPGVRNYARFKQGIAPRLQEELADGVASPLAGLHPYRLHKAYLAASGASRAGLERLPERLLETELLLKGEASRPDVALEGLVTELAALTASR